MTMQTTKFYQAHVITPRNIVVFFDYGQPVTIPSSNDKYESIKELLQNGDYEAVPSAVDVALSIRSHTAGKFNVVNGVVHINNEPLPEALSDMLLLFVEKRLDTGPLEKFWDNLKDNPAESARQDLFAFLKANEVPLTPDGCFIAYKKVKDSWWDSYTGKTYLNKPGMTVTMDRDKVDPDRRNTCSRGLHVAAFQYANNFSGERLLEVKVNPRDVVAVPPDYDQQKMRVCQYTVLRQTNQKYALDIYTEAPVEKV